MHSQHSPTQIEEKGFDSKLGHTPNPSRTSLTYLPLPLPSVVNMRKSDVEPICNNLFKLSQIFLPRHLEGGNMMGGVKKKNEK